VAVIWEKHDAIVTSNEDDQQIGRIKCACLSLLGDEDTELPMWIPPVLEWGFFMIPDVGENVELEIAASSDQDESNGQMSIDNLDVRWRGKRYYTVDEPENNNKPTQIHPDFKANYGKRRGFATPHGHIFLFDDDEKNPTIQLTFQKPTIEIGKTPKASDVSRLEIESDGSLKVTLLEKTTLSLQTDGKKFTIGIDGGASLEITEKDANTTTKIGDGAVSAAIADNLKTYIDNSVKVYLDAHTHPDAFGGTGAPVTQMPAYASNITSTKLKFPNG
jgi:hypothetical protein